MGHVGLPSNGGLRNKAFRSSRLERTNEVGTIRAGLDVNEISFTSRWPRPVLMTTSAINQLRHGYLALLRDAVARHGSGTGLSRVLPCSWDHLGCQLWDHRRVASGGRGGLSAMCPGRSIWRSQVVFREVRVNEVREVLRHWLAGDCGLRVIAERSGVDRKTARRYVQAAVAVGLVRDGTEGQLSDELIGAVIAAVRPVRQLGHGAAWDRLLAEETQLTVWIGKGLQLTNIHGKLARRGVVVPYRTLHRFAVERCGFGRRQPTVRVADGKPGHECQLDFGRLGLMMTRTPDGGGWCTR